MLAHNVLDQLAQRPFHHFLRSAWLEFGALFQLAYNLLKWDMGMTAGIPQCP
jgi:hypothetical protein